MKLIRKSKPYALSATSAKRLSGVHPILQKLVKEMLFYIDVSVIEGLRSLETQKAYVERGVSKTLSSAHLDGHAVDLYPFPVPRLKNGEIDSESKKWNEMALVAYYCAGKMGIEELEWGGTWKTLVDKPHFQINL